MTNIALLYIQTN